jgi:hypothetical protein
MPFSVGHSAPRYLRGGMDAGGLPFLEKASLARMVPTMSPFSSRMCSVAPVSAHTRRAGWCDEWLGSHTVRVGEGRGQTGGMDAGGLPFS